MLIRTMSFGANFIAIYPRQKAKRRGLILSAVFRKLKGIKFGTLGARRISGISAQPRYTIGMEAVLCGYSIEVRTVQEGQLEEM